MHVVFARRNVWRFTVDGETYEKTLGPHVRTAESALAMEFENRVTTEERRALARLAVNPSDRRQIEYQWRAAHGSTAEHVQDWVCREYPPEGDEKERDLDMSSSWSGVPLAAMTGILNDFARAGWRVISVGEDKGLYLGVDAPDEAFPARVRYLLGRPVPAA